MPGQSSPADRQRNGTLGARIGLVDLTADGGLGDLIASTPRAAR